MSSARREGDLPPPDVEDLAGKANVSVERTGMESLGKQLNDVVDFLGSLRSMDLEGVEPELGVRSKDAREAREDEVRRFCKGDDLVAMMPERDGRFAVVPSAKGEEDDGGAEGAEEPSEELQGIELRVGRIRKVSRHPEADKLYVEEVDVGEEEPRTICSGLVPYLNEEDLHDRLVIVFCNMKVLSLSLFASLVVERKVGEDAQARNMRGVKSHGMLLAASDAERSVVTPVQPPEGSEIGERVTWRSPDYQQSDPFPANKVILFSSCFMLFFELVLTPLRLAVPPQVQKKKVWESVQPDMVTDGSGKVEWKGLPMCTSAGAVSAPVPQGVIS